MRRRVSLAGVVLVAGLVAPWGADEPPPPDAARSPFAWNRDAQWTALETRFQALRAGGCATAQAQVLAEQAAAEALLVRLETGWFDPAAPELDAMEDALFAAATALAACPADEAATLRWLARFRDAVKRQSTRWELTTEPSRSRLYRLLYAARATLEEALLQQAHREVPPVARGRDVPGATPFVTVQGVEVHSGDLLVSRGGAATSALIARGSDYPGNFSHVALLHVDAQTRAATVIEAHIEVGVKTSTLEQYLADKKLRVMVLRAREDLPLLQRLPLTPHLAAEAALTRARHEAIAYDFAMDAADHGKLFCSEVAFAAYETQGLALWPGRSHISSPGTRAWLWSVGVRNFATLEPSDLEYDPQLAIVAEWFDPEALNKDHRDNAVTDVLLEAAERGESLGFDWWRLPLARLVKGWSVALNLAGKTGPIPAGMGPEAALRSVTYLHRHAELSARLETRAALFEQEHHYAAPYWQLVRLARD